MKVLLLNQAFHPDVVSSGPADDGSAALLEAAAHRAEIPSPQDTPAWRLPWSSEVQQ